MTKSLVAALGAATCALALFVAAPAQAEVTGGAGFRGSSSVPQGTCHYRNSGLRGWLAVGVPSPAATGVNTTSSNHDEQSYVRYAVWLVNYYSGTTQQASSWSSWLSVRERSWRSWTSGTSFNADWRGDYRLVLRFEWWRGTRRLGWRSHRITAYKWFNQYNVGPFGPMLWCKR